MRAVATVKPVPVGLPVTQCLRLHQVGHTHVWVGGVWVT
jgi:hypothetical protein